MALRLIIQVVCSIAVGPFLIVIQCETRVSVTDCTTEAAVNGDGDAHLICYFPWYLNQSQLSIGVYRTKSNDTEKVFGCNWDHAGYLCGGNNAFTAGEVDINQLHVRIPSDESAEYYCNISPPEKSTLARRCSFLPKNNGSTNLSAEITVHKPNNQTQNRTKCDNEPCQSLPEIGSSPISTVLLAVLVPMSVIVVCLILYFWRRQKRRMATFCVQRDSTIQEPMLLSENTRETTARDLELLSDETIVENVHELFLWTSGEDSLCVIQVCKNTVEILQSYHRENQGQTPLSLGIKIREGALANYCIERDRARTGKLEAEGAEGGLDGKWVSVTTDAELNIKRLPKARHLESCSEASSHSLGKHM